VTKTTITVGIYLTEDERRHLTNLCNELEAMEESAQRRSEGSEAATRAAEQAALRKLMNLPAASAAQAQAQAGFVPTDTDCATLGRIYDAAPPVHVGDLTRRLVQRILAVACPVQSNECAIRGVCTNKCGALTRCEASQSAGTWICPTCGDPKCGEV